MSTITVVNRYLLLTLASDKSQTMELRYGGGATTQTQVTVATPAFSDGGVRKSSVPGRQRKWSASVKAVRPDQITYLENDASGGGWIGQVVWVRDFHGRKFSAIFDAPQIQMHDYNDEADCTLSFSEITLSEAV